MKMQKGRGEITLPRVRSGPCFQVAEKGVKSEKSELLSLKSPFDFFDRKTVSCITNKFQNIVHILLGLSESDRNNILPQ